MHVSKYTFGLGIKLRDTSSIGSISMQCSVRGYSFDVETTVELRLMNASSNFMFRIGITRRYYRTEVSLTFAPFIVPKSDKR